MERGRLVKEGGVGFQEKTTVVWAWMEMIEMEVNGHIWNVFWKILIKNYWKAIMYNTFSFGQSIHCCEGRNLACQFPSPSITWRLFVFCSSTCRNSQEITAAYFLAQNSFLLHFSPFGEGGIIWFRNSLLNQEFLNVLDSYPATAHFWFPNRRHFWSTGNPNKIK